MESTSYTNKKSLFLVFLLFLVNFAMLYPGFFTPDSNYQFQQSKTMALENHHPALLSIVWHYLNFIHEGSQVVLFASLGMIWASVYLFYSSWKDKLPTLSKVLFIMPFTPAIISNSAIIWKDVLIGNSLLLAIAIAVYLNYRRVSTNIKHISFFFICLLLMFSVGVKFQVKFIAPLLAMFFIYFIYKPTKMILILGAIIIPVVAIISVNSINKAYKVKDLHSEQLRQFFDIAGISVCANIDKIPDFVQKDHPDYSFEKLKQKYDPHRVDYFVDQNGVYSPTQDIQKLSVLEQSFFRAALEHPICYLAHRAKVFSYLIISSSYYFSCSAAFGGGPNDVGFFDDYGNSFFVKYISKQYLHRLKVLDNNLIFGLLNIAFIFIFSRKLVGAPSDLKKDILMCLSVNSICLAFELTMFFTIMAADNRYLYFVRLATSFFLPLQIWLYLQLRRFSPSKN